MKTITLTAVLTIGLFITAPHQSDSIVYICTGPSATAYHKTDRCNGLNKCSGDIKRVTVSEAREKHRHPCKICFR